VNVHYIPVHQHPYYRERFSSEAGYPVAEHAYERLISLPMFHSMTVQDVGDVTHAVRKVVTHYDKET
jgi:perosamine synthetase